MKEFYCCPVGTSEAAWLYNKIKGTKCPDYFEVSTFLSDRDPLSL